MSSARTSVWIRASIWFSPTSPAPCSHWPRPRQEAELGAARALDTVLARTVNAPHLLDGAVAQLGERVVRNDEVRGSIPLSSTNLSGCAECLRFSTGWRNAA